MGRPSCEGLSLGADEMLPKVAEVLAILRQLLPCRTPSGLLFSKPYLQHVEAGEVQGEPSKP